MKKWLESSFGKGGYIMSELKEIRERALVGVRDIVRENVERVREAYEWIMRLEHIVFS